MDHTEQYLTKINSRNDGWWLIVMSYDFIVMMKIMRQNVYAFAIC